jgi:Cu-Zn family superoxide dismutase
MKQGAILSLAGFAIAAFIGAGCETSSHEHHSHAMKPTAVAVLSSASGSSVGGTVTFVKESEGVRVIADIKGLTPGKHGFHVHEKGDCSAPDAASAGAHFNPTGSPHAAPEATPRHAGDLGNITADDKGNARYERLDTTISFDGPNSVIGRAVIVHGKPDDFSQPAGNAGPRVACGVIQMK